MSIEEYEVCISRPSRLTGDFRQGDRAHFEVNLLLLYALYVSIREGSLRDPLFVWP
jgi:hypothetical protein